MYSPTFPHMLNEGYMELHLQFCQYWLAKEYWILKFKDNKKNIKAKFMGTFFTETKMTSLIKYPLTCFNIFLVIYTVNQT